MQLTLHTTASNGEKFITVKSIDEAVKVWKEHRDEEEVRASDMLGANGDVLDEHGTRIVTIAYNGRIITD